MSGRDMEAQAGAGRQLEVDNLSRHFGGVVAVKDVTFAVDKGSITGLIGPNGAGKTTLLNLITGYLRPHSGHVRIGGKDLTGRRPHAVARAGVARTYQNLLLLEDEDVIENVRIGRHLADRSMAVIPWRSRESRDRERQVILDLIEELELADVATSPVASLPYGLRRRVEIARALATEPSVLILDEPTAGMTREESDDIASVVAGLRERGSTVLLVEHNVRLVTQICDEVLVLNWGELIGRESADKVWDLDAVKTAYLGVTAHDEPEAPPAPEAERTSNAERL
ncbi:ABC transporter ATP-binding protein [Streptomyces sp. NPDC005708]|uniref:ABC transporter ATP-binding protein n=1 Tax=Streptomyces sp. NPDC005708 TaxID=3154564 RepID=UPI0033EC8E1C